MRKLLFLLYLLPAGAWATISAPINCALNSGGTGATIVTAGFGTVASACATAASNTAGNHITVYILYQVTSGASITTGCSDNAGNTYHLITGTATASGTIAIVDMAYADNIVSASGNFVTCSMSTAPGSSGRQLYAEEVSGVATSSSLDTKVVKTGISSTTITTTIVTAVPNEMVTGFVGSAGARGTSTAGTGFTLARAGGTITTEYDIVGAAGTYTGALSWTTTGIATAFIVAAFKPGAASAQIRHRVVAQ